MNCSHLKSGFQPRTKWEEVEEMFNKNYDIKFNELIKITDETILKKLNNTTHVKIKCLHHNEINGVPIKSIKFGNEKTFSNGCKICRNCRAAGIMTLKDLEEKFREGRKKACEELYKSNHKDIYSKCDNDNCLNIYDYSQLKLLPIKEKNIFVHPIKGEFEQTGLQHRDGANPNFVANIERGLNAAITKLKNKEGKFEDFPSIIKNLPQEEKESILQELNDKIIDNDEKYKDIYTIVDLARISNRLYLLVNCTLHGLFKISKQKFESKKSECLYCKESVMSKELLIKKSQELYKTDKFDYSNVPNKLTSRTEIEYKCPNGHLNKKSIHAHLCKHNDYGCFECYKDIHHKDTEKFIKEALEKHTKDKYSYEECVYINSKTKVKITCKKHGLFEQRPDKHIEGQGCPVCNESKGERECRKVLEKLGIVFTAQKKYKRLVHKGPLSLDFYFRYKDGIRYAIEYNGEQHYNEIAGFKSSDKLSDTQIRDEVKKKYCEENSINLLVIKYDDPKPIEEQIKEFLEIE